jgi:hypothetical protein
MAKLYRAVPRAGFDETRRYTRHETPRAPSNVPYVVDNIWELLRPATMPSRRYAVYASPTPELALANASSAGASRADYLVCELKIDGAFSTAQLMVTDARYHEDIRAVQKVVMQELGAEFAAMPFEKRRAVAPLFMPYIQPEDLQAIAIADETAASCISAARNASKFWSSASSVILADCDGELFFELAANASYILIPI